MKRRLLGPDHMNSERSAALLSLARRDLTLARCPLPKGMRLATPSPRQAIFDGLAGWAFVLEYTDRTGNKYWHLAQYIATVRDAQQMAWAVEDFHKELVAAGVSVESSANPPPVPRQSAWVRREQLYPRGTRSKMESLPVGNAVAARAARVEAWLRGDTC